MGLEQKQKSEECSEGDFVNQRKKKKAYFKGKSSKKIIVYAFVFIKFTQRPH